MAGYCARYCVLLPQASIVFVELKGHGLPALKPQQKEFMNKVFHRTNLIPLARKGFQGRRQPHFYDHDVVLNVGPHA